MKRVAFHTLGCKLNFSESSEIGRQLETEGYQRVAFGESAEVTVIHTCSVTGAADRKTRQAIHKAVKTSPEGFIVAMGCVAQLKPEEVASWEGVDLILGSHEKFSLADYLGDLRKKKQPEIHSCEIFPETGFHHAHSETERTRAFLKVQDGCDYLCTYCTIPKARGTSRNPAISEIVEQARRLADKGVREIVITGVNVGDFGRSTGETFLALVKELTQIKSVLRFRISSIEPNLLSDELIELIGHSENFAGHFHLPLQAGTDEILQLMKRRYNRDLFSNRIEKILDSMPEAGIGLDVIVGFPGETDALFDDTVRFLNELPISYLHVFTYSERPGTPAEKYPNKVTNQIRDERSKRLHLLSDLKKKHFLEQQINLRHKVIFESQYRNSWAKGFTGNYAEVIVPWQDGLLHHDLEVCVTEMADHLLLKGHITNSLS